MNIDKKAVPTRTDVVVAITIDFLLLSLSFPRQQPAPERKPSPRKPSSQRHRKPGIPSVVFATSEQFALLEQGSPLQLPSFHHANSATSNPKDPGTGSSARSVAIDKKMDRQPSTVTFSYVIIPSPTSGKQVMFSLLQSHPSPGGYLCSINVRDIKQPETDELQLCSRRAFFHVNA